MSATGRPRVDALLHELRNVTSKYMLDGGNTLTVLNLVMNDITRLHLELESALREERSERVP